MLQKFLLILITITLALFFSSATQARNLVGTLGDQTVYLQTTLLEGGEYVKASSLVDFYGDRWQYDPLSGTLNFTRTDGSLIGMKVGDQRVLVGRRVVHTGKPLVRQDRQVYIPFSTAIEYLFPQSQFRETNEEPPKVTPIATPSSFVFTLTPTAPPAAEPTVSLVPPQTTPAAEQTGVTFTPFGIIVLDPGNDPANPGVTGPNGLKECDLTMILCEKIANVLKQTATFQVLFTRDRDNRNLISDDERAAYANQNDGTLFVSVHCGGMVNNEVSRGTIYYMNETMDSPLPREQEQAIRAYNLTPWRNAYKPFTPESYQLAKSLLAQLDRYYKVSNIIQLDSGPRSGRFTVLRGLAMPAVIVELGNFSHPATNRFLSTERNQNDIALYLANGITNYLVERSGVSQAMRTP